MFRWENVVNNKYTHLNTLHYSYCEPAVVIVLRKKFRERLSIEGNNPVCGVHIVPSIAYANKEPDSFVAPFEMMKQARFSKNAG